MHLHYLHLKKMASSPKLPRPSRRTAGTCMLTNGVVCIYYVPIRLVIPLCSALKLRFIYIDMQIARGETTMKAFLGGLCVTLLLCTCLPELKWNCYSTEMTYKCDLLCEYAGTTREIKLKANIATTARYNHDDKTLCIVIRRSSLGIHGRKINPFLLAQNVCVRERQQQMIKWIEKSKQFHTVEIKKKKRSFLVINHKQSY